MNNYLFYGLNKSFPLTDFPVYTPEDVFSFNINEIQQLLMYFQIPNNELFPRTTLIKLLEINSRPDGMKRLAGHDFIKFIDNKKLLSDIDYEILLRFEYSINNNLTSDYRSLTSALLTNLSSHWKIKDNLKWIYLELDPEHITRYITNYNKNKIPYDEYKRKILDSYQKNVDITENLLYSMYENINQLYFNNRINVMLSMLGKYLKIQLSDKMVSSGGIMKNRGNHYLITISMSHCNLSDKSLYKNSGINCQGNLDAVFTTLTHELTHVLVHLIIDLKMMNENIIIQEEGRYASHGDLFKELALNYFGLTDITHSMFHKGVPTPIEIQSIISPGLTSPGLTSPGLTSPGLTSPGLTSPGLTSPGLTSPGLTSPGLTSSGLTSSGLTSPGLTSPGLTSPGLTSSDLENNESRKGYSKNDFRIGDKVWLIHNNEIHNVSIISMGPVNAVLKPIINPEKSSGFRYPYEELYKIKPSLDIIMNKKNIIEERKRELRVGDKVRFDFGGKGIHDGIVQKLNPKRALVKFSIGSFNIPYSNIILL
jgi:hypothetical protein